jgi:acyl-CoA dehydrogenase
MHDDTWRATWYTDDVRDLQHAVRRIYVEKFAPLEERWTRQGEVDRDIWRTAADAGLLCAGIDAEYGGLGGTFAHEAMIYYEQIRCGVPSFGNTVHSGIVAHYIAAYGSGEQKRRWLPRLASGEMVAAIAMSEPGAGSDLRSLRTTARRAGGHYLVTGSKTFISNGHQADLVCVAVRHDSGARTRNLSLLIVEAAETPGFVRGNRLDKIGLRGQDTCELFFDSARVPCSHLLGSEGQGFEQMMQQLPRERMIVALMGLGTIDRALAETLRHVRSRQLFGGTLLDLQDVRFKLAEAVTDAAVARAYVTECIGRVLAGDLDAAGAAMAKWWTTDAQCRIVDRCLQLHGGLGYMSEAPISRMYLDSRIQTIYGGANEIMKEIIARSL